MLLGNNAWFYKAHFYCLSDDFHYVYNITTISSTDIHGAAVYSNEKPPIRDSDFGTFECSFKVLSLTTRSTTYEKDKRN